MAMIGQNVFDLSFDIVNNIFSPSTRNHIYCFHYCYHGSGLF